ncbi:hypothetical protein CKAH01_03206 [Colletotrichum kahawae]|uniref:Uncharacterized protein n=1 Tax=Colletotrichum kahawae TaxID=34407 RepID=A0AAD9YV53_COLKA|nr:hypothetical protein CKAH01_03206 [Colletotrichum kahawae]
MEADNEGNVFAAVSQQGSEDMIEYSNPPAEGFRYRDSHFVASPTLASFAAISLLNEHHRRSQFRITRMASDTVENSTVIPESAHRDVPKRHVKLTIWAAKVLSGDSATCHLAAPESNVPPRKDRRSATHITGKPVRPLQLNPNNG